MPAAAAAGVVVIVPGRGLQVTRRATDTVDVVVIFTAAATAAAAVVGVVGTVAVTTDVVRDVLQSLFVRWRAHGGHTADALDSGQLQEQLGYDPRYGRRAGRKAGRRAGRQARAPGGAER